MSGMSVSVRGGVEMGTNGLAKALAMLREELAQDEGAGHQFRLEITEGDGSRPPCPLQ
jgi:hypothetical protein